MKTKQLFNTQTNLAMENIELKQKLKVPRPTRRWLQFSMRTLLVLSLVGGVGLGVLGMRIKRQREEARETRRTYHAVYNVADLVLPASGSTAPADYDTLITEIETNITPESWEGAGGRAAIAAFETNLSLVVSHTDKGHQQLTRFLEAKRAGAITTVR